MTVHSQVVRVEEPEATFFLRRCSGLEHYEVHIQTPNQITDQNILGVPMQPPLFQPNLFTASDFL